MWISAGILFLACQALGSPVIDSPSGRLSGWESVTRDGRVYQAWTRVPFARPPIGKYRFKVPEPIGKWNSTLNATGNTPYCFQMRIGKITGQEDCLYLDVFRPKVIVGKLPVLVYVHGGSFQTDKVGPRGSAEYLMDEDVILVQINYRLNGFGFMTLGDAALPGNIGMKDQVLALKWVKENIAAFSGDPNRITVFGGSAGGASTHLLMTSPLSKDLVTQAVSHSGSINRIWSLLETGFVKNCTLQVVQQVGCVRKTNEEILACLQKANSTRLLMAMVQMQMKTVPIIPWVPVIEPKSTQGAFAVEDLSLLPSNKPWITSFSNGEYILFLGSLGSIPKSTLKYLSQHVLQWIESLIEQHLNNPVIADEGAKVLTDKYFTQPAPMVNFTRQLALMLQDNSFVFPAIANVMRHQGPKWLSFMEYKGELSARDVTGRKQYPDPVAGHDSEKFYYLNFRSRFNVSSKETPADYKVSKRLIKYLVNFAHFGDPTPTGTSFKWPQFDTGNMLRITGNGDAVASRGFYRKFLSILDMWSYYIGWK